MKIKLERLRKRAGWRCRYCKDSAKWQLWRGQGYTWEHLCDTHVGVALRNLGLTKLTIEHSAVCTAEVRP